MSNQLAIEVLQKRLEELVKEREKIWADYGKRICEIDMALQGLGEWTHKADPQYTAVYDDESPHYIKSSSVED